MVLVYTGWGFTMNVSTEGLALSVCRQLYEDTNGRPMVWRQTVRGCLLQMAVEYGVDRGWLLLNERDRNVCLTEEGWRLVRKTLS